jgi:hypothetical protein
MFDLVLRNNGTRRIRQDTFNPLCTDIDAKEKFVIHEQNCLNHAGAEYDQGQDRSNKEKCCQANDDLISPSQGEVLQRGDLPGTEAPDLGGDGHLIDDERCPAYDWICQWD